jgi:ABC-2 type transport system ATP-binding protein
VPERDGVVIETHDLSRRFGTFTAVDRVSIAVSRGEIFGFLGANGAGKTTTIRMLIGVLRPSSGRARVAGYDVARDAERVKRSIGYMSQRFALYNDLTVEENLRFYGGVYGVRAAALRSRCDALLVEFDLGELRRARVGALAGGWRQKVALGCALVHEPPILFLDEPTGGVDPVARRLFWRVIHRLAQRGTTVFVTTHYLDEAEYCHRVSIMHAGRIIALDTPAELRRAAQRDTLEDVFVTLVTAKGAVA